MFPSPGSPWPLGTHNGGERETAQGASAVFWYEIDFWRTKHTGKYDCKRSLQVFVLAGQSNMEGQAEVTKQWPNGTERNGTLTYQLHDPRTAAEFAPTWDQRSKDWTVLDNVSIWFNENGKTDLPVDLGQGTYGALSIGYGCGGSRAHIGPEYGFGFRMNDALEEPFLIIKTAWGGKTLCGDFRPPSSCQGNESKVGFYYKQMLQYVDNVLAPGNLSKIFPHLRMLKFLNHN